jgi:phosphatidylserine/phosphatidylglycerophosphate/cardiolipin synthase-like enzyme
MRVRKTSANGLTVHAVAGTYVVLLGFNIRDGQRPGLLGFSIHRTDHTEQTAGWLLGALRFPSVPSDAGEEITTRIAPIQKFRWGDYTAKPNHRYTYRVEARYGPPQQLETRDAVEVTVTTEDPLRVGPNGHQVHFNRSAAASQAYVRRFGDRDPDQFADGSAHRWLSRGLEENLIAFIERARDSNDALYLCVYEFEKDSILAALRAAAKRKVRLEIIYDAIVKFKTDKKTGKKTETGPRRENEKAIQKHKLGQYCTPRNAIDAISHNKFIVHARNGQPLAVWTGSTNFTDGGIYGQANVGHAVDDPELARRFFDLHQELKGNPAAAASRASAQKHSPLPAPAGSALYPIFSPRKTTEAITLLAQHVDRAQSLVCFTCPFELHDEIEDALDDSDDPFLKFGLLDKRGNVVERVHKSSGARMAAAARLETQLDAWQKESFHHRGLYIHTKYFLIDPLSEHPVVITGSANFSRNSSVNNDENQLVILGDKAVADVYLCEFMRMYDHYAFRDFIKKTKAQPKKRGLAENDSWTNKYFTGQFDVRDRTAFA